MTNLAKFVTHRTGTQLINVQHWINFATTGERKYILPECVDKKIYKRQVQNVTEEETAIGGEFDESESSIYRIEKIKKITDRNKYLTAKVKVNGIEKEFIAVTGLPISIMPPDENILKKTVIQKIKHRYQVVNKNEVNFRGQTPTDIEYENNKQKMQVLTTERDDITPLLGMDWMKKINVTIRNIRTDENNQSEKK